MSRNQAGGTELIPMPRPTEAAQLSLPTISYSALHCSALQCTSLLGKSHTGQKSAL